ncbi:MAG: sulfotransferase domain-containing protein [Sphingobacteriia bacterium]|nr:sulfotransferase domain-containing protein [Sphingobacteriia bacterium]
MEVPKKIVWLASYPKSGNTWMRAFLSALLNNGEVDINKMVTKTIFSSRDFFSEYTDIDSTYLTDKEAKQLQPEVFNYLAITDKSEKIFIKVHDAYTLNQFNKPIIPTESTFCAIYIIRNPLDIVASLANHTQISINKAVHSLVDDDYCWCAQNGNINTDIQFRQYLSNWSYHVNSWTLYAPFPVYLIKYEDMVVDTFNTFKKVVKSIEADKFNDREILKAIDAAGFAKLQEQELTSGFKENFTPKTLPFFRKGAINNWREELDVEQASSIINAHKKIMLKYNYC